MTMELKRLATNEICTFNFGISKYLFLRNHSQGLVLLDIKMASPTFNDKVK